MHPVDSAYCSLSLSHPVTLRQMLHVAYSRLITNYAQPLCYIGRPLLSFSIRPLYLLGEEYWKYFVARFNDVHVFGYNSTGSERIWMKFGELRVYCLELALADFGRDLRRSESGRPYASFVFFVR